MMKLVPSKFAIAGIVMAAMYAAPANAQATRTWVSGVGSDVNPCSRTAPCKTFAGAISKTAANGKINCLDPGGFGAVTITKSIEIDCFAFPGGILSAGTNGVVVATTPNIRVILRGIEIHGGGTGLDGVRVIIPADVLIDKCFITAITGDGVEVSINSAGTANVVIQDTTMTQMANGITMNASAGGAAILRLHNSTIARVTTSAIQLTTSNVFATVTRSLLTGNTTGGLVSGNGAQLNVIDSDISNNVTGLNASVSGAQVRMSDNNIHNNTTSTAFVGGATLSSAGNNKIDPLGAIPNATIGNQ